MKTSGSEILDGVTGVLGIALVLSALVAVPLGCVFALVYVARLAWTLAGG